MAGKFKVSFIFLLVFLSNLWACRADMQEYLNKACRVGKFQQENIPFKHWACFGKGHKIQQVCVLTTDIVPEIKGYSGPIEVFFCINSTAQITHLEIVRHNETFEYAGNITSLQFLGQFIGKNPLSRDFRLGKSINGITGATISSAAVVESVRQAGRKVFYQVFLPNKLPSAGLNARSHFNKGYIFIIAYFLFAIIVMLKRAVFLRWFFVFFSVIFFGFIKAMFLSVYNLEQAKRLFLNSIKYMPFWLFFFILVFLVTLFFGRTYCGFICPFGALQDIFSLLPFKKKKVPYKINRKLLALKYIFLLLVLIAFSLGYKNFLKLEPFVPVFKFLAKDWGFWLGVGFLSIAAVVPRFYCRYFCLVGAVLGIIGRFSFLKYKMKSCRSQSCRICADKCLVGVIDESRNIIDNECIRCNLCQKCHLEKQK